ncbi:MAG TPA: 50S ribosomal protein L29 [Acholeplasmataceae bacterium]|nr:50S ribosomal protein L29 [Acholeplasmataceae bacterium]
MKAAEIRNLKTKDIESKIAELKAELFNLRFQHAVGQLENTAKLRTVKKTIAQMKTIITERGE